MTAEIWKQDPDISHESPHCMLIFKVSKQIPKLRVKSIQFPDDKDALKQLGDEIAKELDQGTGSKLDILYNAIKSAFKTCNLVRTFKLYGKLKFYWTDEDYME